MQNLAMETLQGFFICCKVPVATCAKASMMQVLAKQLTTQTIMKAINTDLVAHGEHILDDVYDTFGNIDEGVAQKIVEFTQGYIEAAVETAFDYPEWFE